MTNLVTSPEASMFEKPTAADIEADESGECDARLAADPEPHDKQGCERNFRNQLEYDEVGVITKRIHQQK
jgi:hypothetical protein